MTSNHPLISVIMPVKNGMPFLAEAVDSIRRQTLKDWELLIVDDGSTDDTPDYLAGLHDPRIHIIRSAGAGFAVARDTGIHGARGQLLARMDADDVAETMRLEVQADFLMRNPGVVGVGAQVSFLVDGIPGKAFQYPCDEGRIVSALRSGRVALSDSTMMFRADAARQVCPKVLGPGGDFDFYLRLAAHGRLVNLNQELLVMRVSRSSMSFAHIEEQLCGIAFSIACDRARANGVPEPDFTAFQSIWNNRSLLHRGATRLRVVHQRCFRRAVIHRAHGNYLRALAYLGTSALLHPAAVHYRFKLALASLRRPAPEGPPSRCAG
jgi:glycosyltransferase involved in cell wall biosynthesis